MVDNKYDVLIIGGGPSGLAAAIASDKQGAKTLLIDREEALGGILKQCVHDGFGLLRFKKQLSGPSYAQAFIDEIEKTEVQVLLNTFVEKIEKTRNETFIVTFTNFSGLFTIEVKSLILATGCRERTFRQINIHGDRPSGIFCAGTAQQLVNRMGHLPGKNIVILGSGDIGLIMARRLVLEGANVLGVYEIKQNPSGLDRNINQCLNDFNIPLHLNTTVTKCFGKDRLEGVNIAQVDNKMKPIKNTEKYLPCDTLIVSVGLIPEIDLVDNLNLIIDKNTKGLQIDQDGKSSLDGIFTCGNSSVVYDLVDLVSRQSEKTGKAAAIYCNKKEKERKNIEIKKTGNTFLTSPQVIDLNGSEDIDLVLRVNTNIEDAIIKITQEDNILFEKNYKSLKMPHMELIELKKNLILYNSPIVVYSGKRSES